MAVFDNVANSYDDWYKNKLGRFVDDVETNLAFSMFPIKKGMKILDVGCGTGNFSIKLAELGCKVIGIDISDDMIDVARKKAKKNNLDIEFYNMDVYNLDFDDNSFDGVLSMAAFEFIDNIEAAYKEMKRVIKEKAHMLIGTINRDSSWGELYTSEECKKNTVFKYASLKTINDFKKIDSNNIVHIKECLFISPQIKEKEINWATEKKLSKTEKGGYFCVVWRKRI